jgi:hypothetical protein
MHSILPTQDENTASHHMSEPVRFVIKIKDPEFETRSAASPPSMQHCPFIWGKDKRLVVVDSGQDMYEILSDMYTCRRMLDTSAPGHFGTCVRHFGTKTVRHPDNSALVFFSLILRTKLPIISDLNKA